LASDRTWPALVVRASAVDETGEIEGLVILALDGCQPLAIEDLTPIPVPLGGLWDPTAPPPPQPPPAPLAWRLCFGDEADRVHAAAAIAALGRGLRLEVVDLPDEDWVARSQATLTAVSAGPFVVAPPWDAPAAVPDGHRLIVIEPSMGFGTGHHPTTRLCLRALGALDVTGQTVVDLGTGSGVLALAAALAGAGAVTGIDNDAEAVAAAERSAALNVLPRPVRFVVGEVAAPAAAADVVLANLTGAMLIRAADHLARRVVPGGYLVVSGFMDDERAGVETALAATFAVEARREEEGWCALTLRCRHD
jgi:ribosomal protein L11 methyltransferase